MTGPKSDMEHEIARLRAENGDLRLALSQEAERLERDDEAREKSSSRFWFAAWGNAQRSNRALSERLAELASQLEGPRRG